MVFVAASDWSLRRDSRRWRQRRDAARGKSVQPFRKNAGAPLLQRGV